MEIEKMFTEEAMKCLKDINNYSEISEDEPICAVCKKRIIDDCPLRCWTDDGKKEIAFHIKCAFGDKVF